MFIIALVNLFLTTPMASAETVVRVQEVTCAQLQRAITKNGEVRLINQTAQDNWQDVAYSDANVCYAKSLIPYTWKVWTRDVNGYTCDVGVLCRPATCADRAAGCGDGHNQGHSGGND